MCPSFYPVLVSLKSDQIEMPSWPRKYVAFSWKDICDIATIATSRYEGKHKILPGSWFIHDEQTINSLPFFAPTESATS